MYLVSVKNQSEFVIFMSISHFFYIKKPSFTNLVLAIPWLLLSKELLIFLQEVGDTSCT